ncbi:MAG: peptide chain release factor N(5)-glutamine methyltransferase [Bacteriovoracaceae bacterium]|nr:peptide chain release factor N(5)-glutamine methyltransferase [Bacteriovoracaceae bacterium]
MKNSCGSDFIFDTNIYSGLNPKILHDYWQIFWTQKQLHQKSFFYSKEFWRSYFQSELNSGRPLQYIVNQAPFFKSEFYVDERVLIPRPETEILVELVAKSCVNGQYQKIAEVGVGSGAPLISLLQEWGPQNAVKIWGTDLSVDALEVTKINLAQKKYLFDQSMVEVNLSKGDRGEDLPDGLDLIYSNPPYVMSIDRLSRQVRDFEPKMSLLVPEEVSYLDWFKVFFKRVCSKLRPGGEFWMEGEYDQWDSLSQILNQAGFNQMTIHKDLTQKERFINAFKHE